MIPLRANGVSWWWGRIQPRRGGFADLQSQLRSVVETVFPAEPRPVLMLPCNCVPTPAIFDRPIRHSPGRPIMRTFSRLIIVTIAIALVSSPAFAQPLADKVPANSLFYFGWRGSEDLGPAYGDSHLKAILDQSNIPAVFSDMIPRAVFRVGRDNPQVGNVLKSITKVAGPMGGQRGRFF